MNDELPNPDTTHLDYGERSSVAETHSAVQREKREPLAAFHPVSMMALVAGGLILTLGGTYLGAYSGGFELRSTYAIANYQAAPRPPIEGFEEKVDNRPWIDKWMESGKEVYATCAACHQPTGNGVVGQFPPLAGSEFVIHGTERLSAIVFPGITGAITVKGQTYNGVMPAQGALLSDKQLAQVLTYVRRSFGNNASIITEEMVKHAREKYGSRTQPWSEAELLAIPQDAMLPGAEIDPLTGLPPGTAPASSGSGS
jgi:mono/diheme cytochrome c family protein